MLKTKFGDIRDMVLPGGGDLSTRVWASMRNKLYQIKKWRGKPAAESSAFKDAIWKLEQFAKAEGNKYEHVWKNPDEKESLQTKAEIFFMIEAI